MKKSNYPFCILLKSLFILFLTNTCYSQDSPWFEFSPNCSETEYIIEHIFENNHMIARIQFANVNFISTDLGQSWTPVDISGRFINEFLYEGETDDLYFSTLFGIYKYETDSKITSLIYENPDWVDWARIDAGLIFENGDILTITRSFDQTDAIKLIDANGAIINSIDIPAFSRVELLHQEGFPTYVTFSTSGTVTKTIHELDMENFTLGVGIEITPYGSGVKYINGKLFSSKFYSTDGGASWTEIVSTEDIRWIEGFAFKDNYAVFFGFDNIHLSEDYGNSFKAIGANPFDHSGNIITFNQDMDLLFYGDWNNSTLYQSDDFGASWSETQNFINIPNSFSLAVSVNDNIIVNSIGCEADYFLDNQWSEAIYPTQDQRSFYLFTALPNKTFDGLGGGNILLSRENGANWIITLEDLSEYSGIEAKQDNTFIAEWNGILYSEDYGVTWNREALTSVRGFFNDLKILQEDSLGFLQIRDILTNNTTLLDKWIDPLLYLDIATEWSGNNYYILEYVDYNKNEILLQSTQNGGIDFTSKIIPIEPVGDRHHLLTDHVGNIIVYSTNQVLLTQDKGTTWIDLTPERNDIWTITDVSVSYDNYLYLSTVGTGVLKYLCPLDNDIENCSLDEVSSLNTLNSQPRFDVNIYPNPVSHYFNIELSSEIEFDLILQDLYGRTILQMSNNNTVDINDLDNGIYLLSVIEKNSRDRVVKKITVAR